MTTTEDEREEFIETIRMNQRPHAGYFSWESDKAIEELGVVQTLDESLEHENSRFFHSYEPRGEGNDPPDCEALGSGGERIGIEVTELVDGSSIAAARRSEVTEWRPWETEELIAILRSRIEAKDNPAHIKGGPYDEYLLIVYCDEPRVLDYGLIERIRSERFGPTSLITRAYFLMSYSPWKGHCPYIELIREHV